MNLLKETLDNENYSVNEFSNGRTPLFCAIATDSYDGTALLLQRGANPNQPFDDIECPLLHYCFETKKLIIMELLLQYGANPNVETKYIRPISLFAALHSSKCAQIVAILLRAGANPLTAKDSSNNSIYTYMQEEFEAVQDKDLKDVYKKIGRALIEYKKLALQLKYQKNIQLEISHLILHAADFGLDDYHRCAMELSDKKLQNI